MTRRIGLYLQGDHEIGYEIEMARHAEVRGFSEVWQADVRLARDCTVMVSALLASTERLRIGSGILPVYTRNPAVIAAAWRTMHELAGPGPDGSSRAMCGLGAWWEPIASQVGAGRRKPLTAMREYVGAVKALFAMEEVSYEGEFVHFDRVRLDTADGDAPSLGIPVLIGAFGPRMLELAGEIADGAVLGYAVTPGYIRDAVSRVAVGAARSGRTVDEIDRPALLICCLSDDDPEEALSAGKSLIAHYLCAKPDDMASLGIDPELIQRVRQASCYDGGGAEYSRAAPLIGDGMARSLMAVGTAVQCLDKASELVDAGATCPVLSPLTPDIASVVDAFGHWSP